MKIKIGIAAPANNLGKSYPYWAVNSNGDLFLLTHAHPTEPLEYDMGIFVGENGCWTLIQNVSLGVVKPLPKGTKITFTV